MTCSHSVLDQIAALENSVEKDKNKRIKELEFEVSELNGLNDGLVSMVEERDLKIDEFDKDIVIYKEEIESLNGDISRLETANKQNGKDKAENIILGKKNRQLVEDNERLLNDHADLAERYKGLDSTNASQRQRLANTSTKITNANNRAVSAENEANNANKKLTETTKELELALKTIAQHEEYERTEEQRFENKFATRFASLQGEAEPSKETLDELKKLRGELEFSKQRVTELELENGQLSDKYDQAFTYAENANREYNEAVDQVEKASHLLDKSELRDINHLVQINYLSLMLESVNSAPIYKSKVGSGYLTLASTKTDIGHIKLEVGETVPAQPHPERPICAWWSPNGIAHLVMVKKPDTVDEEPTLLMSNVQNIESMIPENERDEIARVINKLENEKIIEALDRAHNKSQRISNLMSIFEGDDCPEKAEMAYKVLDWKKNQKIREAKDNFEAIQRNRKSKTRKPKAKTNNKKKRK